MSHIFFWKLLASGSATGKFVLFRKNHYFFWPSAVPLSLHPTLSRTFLEVKRKGVPAKQKFAFFLNKLRYFPDPRLFDFPCKNKEFWFRFWKIRFFVRRLAALTKISNLFGESWRPAGRRVNFCIFCNKRKTHASKNCAKSSENKDFLI